MSIFGILSKLSYILVLLFRLYAFEKKQKAKIVILKILADVLNTFLIKGQVYAINKTVFLTLLHFSKCFKVNVRNKANHKVQLCFCINLDILILSLVLS